MPLTLSLTWLLVRSIGMVLDTSRPSGYMQTGDSLTQRWKRSPHVFWSASWGISELWPWQI